MNDQTSANRQYGQFGIRWIFLSQLLLVLYLSFFNMCLNQPPERVMSLAIIFSIAALAVTIYFRNWFASRFEFMIHLVIGVDIFGEGFNPDHTHLGFYGCALAFWTTFWCYHWFLSVRTRGFETGPSRETGEHAQAISTSST